MTRDLNTFLEEFKISHEDLTAAGLDWDELLEIKKDYRSIRRELYLITRYIEEKLATLPTVHSVRTRVKDPDHLIAKIIRKTIADPGRKITIDNYRTEITDLIGIRAIHLFKEDWVHIHDFISENWDFCEVPIAYIRVGDNGAHVEEYRKYSFDIKQHPYGYRSIHYLIESRPNKDTYIAEIQVRTIFEEGWSEIDHTIKYPKDLADPLLNTFLDNFNILAGNSDQMGSFVRNLKEDLVKGTQKLEMYEKLTEKHTGIIDSLKKRVACTVGELRTKVQAVEDKIDLLETAGIETRPFQQVLERGKKLVLSFEKHLSSDPERACTLFERSSGELSRLEKLLEIVLAYSNEQHEHTNESLSTSYERHIARVTHTVHVISELEKEIERDIVAHFQDHNGSRAVIQQAIEDVSAHNTVNRFLFGPPQKAVRILYSEIRSNAACIKALSQAAERLTDPAAQYVIWFQIELLQEQNNKLKTFVTEQSKGFSVFGWFFRMLP
jgi:putative GTP pyrophosphokinase